jgi:hypothetical protein
MISRNTPRGVVPALLGAAAAALIAVTAFAGADPRIPFPPPASHAGKWLDYHGRAVGAGGSAAGRPGPECTVCHDRADCISCHSQAMPRDHTNAWRTRVHGLMAAGNAGRCAVCHREDYCIRCHQETAPRTHTGSWRRRHCGACHFGPGQTIAGNCSVCHKRPGHPAAPHPVNPGLVCIQCHT